MEVWICINQKGCVESRGSWEIQQYLVAAVKGYFEYLSEEMLTEPDSLHQRVLKAVKYEK